MKTLPSLLALTALLVTGCAKTDPANDKPLPKRNTAEALGFSTGEDYSQPAERPAPPPPAADPAPSAPSPEAPAAYKPIAHILTGKDGRKVDVLLLSRSATTVTFVRRADQLQFTLALDKLSEADQEFLSQSTVPLLPAP